MVHSKIQLLESEAVGWGGGSGIGRGAHGGGTVMKETDMAKYRGGSWGGII